MNDTVATEDQEQPAGCHQRKARVSDRDPGRRIASGPADICSAPTEAGHMTAADQIVRSAKKVLAMEGRSLIASPLSMVFVAAPGHGSLRDRSNPPQHLVRSTGAAMSTTSWHTMPPLKAHSRSHPYPRPAGNHYIRNLARVNLTNNGVSRLLRAPTSGTALPNARHYAR